MAALAVIPFGDGRRPLPTRRRPQLLPVAVQIYIFMYQRLRKKVLQRLRDPNMNNFVSWWQKYEKLSVLYEALKDLVF